MIDGKSRPGKRAAGLGPGYVVRLINTSAPVPVTFLGCWYRERHSERSASPGMRPTDPNLLTRDRGCRVPGPPPYVTDHDRGHESCSKFCGLRGISVLPAASDCVAQRLQHEFPGTQNPLSQIESKL